MIFFSTKFEFNRSLKNKAICISQKIFIFFIFKKNEMAQGRIPHRNTKFLIWYTLHSKPFKICLEINISNSFLLPIKSAVFPQLASEIKFQNPQHRIEYPSTLKYRKLLHQSPYVYRYTVERKYKEVRGIRESIEIKSKH